VGNIFGFTGREFDSESHLYYYRARYYDPALGRFLSADPIGFAAGDSNFYRYVSNNPLKYKDPSGKIIPAILATYVAYEVGYFIGSLFNSATTDTTISGTYSGGYSAFSNLNEQILPASNLFSQPDTYKVIDDAVNKRREQYLDEQIQRQCQ
jgi:RHS repeat-associated protein